jgi:hypothetical protein
MAWRRTLLMVTPPERVDEITDVGVSGVWLVGRRLTVVNLLLGLAEDVDC